MGKDDVLFRYVPLKRSNRSMVEGYLAEMSMYDASYTDIQILVDFFNANAYDEVILTVATKLDHTAGTVHYGWAVQAPGDRHNKSMARTIASGRLTKHPVVLTHDKEQRLVDQFMSFVYSNPDQVFGPYRRTLRSVAADYMADGNINVSAALTLDSADTKDNSNGE